MSTAYLNAIATVTQDLKHQFRNTRIIFNFDFLIRILLSNTRHVNVFSSQTLFSDFTTNSSRHSFAVVKLQTTAEAEQSEV